MGDSREQAIAAALALPGDRSWGSGTAEAVLDAAHQAGHIYYADEIDAGHDVLTEVRADNERLRAAIARHLGPNARPSDVDAWVDGALGDGEEGGRP